MKAALRRLERIERIRAIAKRTSAAEAATAENARSQLTALAERTRALAADYARADNTTDGATLALIMRFGSGLQHLSGVTAHDAARAGAIADEKFAALADAESRRAAVGERIAAEKQRLARTSQAHALTARRRDREFGTNLERDST
jgi:hypothetical protein